MASIGATVALIKALAPKADPAVIQQAVADYLEAHPEISVADGSITEEKLAADVAGILDDLQDDVTDVKNAIDGVEDNVSKLIDVTDETVSPTIVQNDGYVKSDGTIGGDGSSWKCSDYIDISSAYENKVSIKSCIYGTAGTVWFAEDKSVIGYVTGGNATDYGVVSKADPQIYNLTLPSNAKYIRISWYKPTYASVVDMQISYDIKSVEVGEFLQEQIDIIDANIQSVSDNADMLKSIVGDPEYMNLVDATKIAADTYIDGSTGVKTASSYYKSSDFLLLKANTLYYVGSFYIGQNTAYQAFYSEPNEDSFIANPDITLTRDASDHCTVLVGSADVYVRFSALKASTNLYVSSFVDYYIAYAGPITLKEMVTPKCRFKKILVMGDSISTDYYGDYKKWVTDLIDEGYFPPDVNNNSVHATGYVARYDNQPNDFITRIKAIENPETYDLVIVFGGINDANALIPMGTDSDTDYTTYLNPAVRYFYSYVCENFINARICMLTPLPCSTQNRDPSVIGVQYTNSEFFKEVAKSYSLPVLDLTNYSGFYPDANKPGMNYNAAQAFKDRWTLVVGQYAADGIHPTEEYEKKFLAPMIKAFIETL